MRNDGADRAEEKIAGLVIFFLKIYFIKYKI